MAAHCGAVERCDVVLVLRLGLESARQHRFEDPGMAALGRAVKHQVMLRTQLGSQSRLSRENRFGRGPIAARARGDETFERRQLVGCARSEEHTSELQSLRHLVCRLLLEKKK